MVRKGRFTIDILVSEDKIEAGKEKIVDALKNLKTSGVIDAASWKLVYEEFPESGTI